MPRYEWDFQAAFLHPDLWLYAVGITLGYAAATIAVGLVIGVICGLMLLNKHLVVRAPAAFFVLVFRGTPLLIQIIWFYYALPVAMSLTIPAWLAAGLGLSFYMGAFSAEIFRGGIQSIDKGQWQAAKAIGMVPWQVMHRVILPQAARRMVPPFVNQSVLQLKNTSLLSIVAVPDMMYTAQVFVSETFRPLEIYTTLGVMYLIIIYPLQKLAKQLERRDDV
ncbi:MAG: amino acid ABC transporter permease [Alphaproteobacteria bacterium]|nr:amino acid ABC transporter permease [Alphaproteobacteria bacterium]